jgi:3-methyladenine DNA glycosylase AlkD
MPSLRKELERFADPKQAKLLMTLAGVKKSLCSKVHEERLAALLVLVHKFEKGNEAEKRTIFDFYLANARSVNNWDLVDLTAPKIAGEWLLDKDKSVLYKLAASENLWERRIAVLSTFAFIRKGMFNDCLAIAEILLYDEHDLIHKAVGWMLREIGKKDLAAEEAFLKKHYREMPRTMLRYAIERFPEKRRKAYLLGKV